MGVLSSLNSDRLASQPHTFVYFINVSKHPRYSLLEKVALSGSRLPSLNPEVLVSKEVMQARVPRMQDAGRTREANEQRASGGGPVVKEEDVMHQQVMPEKR